LDTNSTTTLDFLPLLGYKINSPDKPVESVANSANQGNVNAKFNYKWPVRGSSLAL
jgi:hypothetical protein